MHKKEVIVKVTVSQGKTKKRKLNTKKQLLKFISVAVNISQIVQHCQRSMSEIQKACIHAGLCYCCTNNRR